MKLTFYAIDHSDVDLRPNPSTREWMDKLPDSFAYRCLPLNIANSHGWSFHTPCDIEVFWDGGTALESLQVRSAPENDLSRVCLSNFGSGILTFFIHGIFRTEEGWNIHVGGPANHPIDGLSPLSGVIETDWAPYSFTMNWQITRKNEWIKIPKNFPYCTVFPVQRDYLETIEPEMRDLSSNLALQQAHEEWGKSRSNFNQALKDAPDGPEARSKWQKHYYQGKHYTGEKGPEDHKIKLRLCEFQNLRLKKPYGQGGA